MRRCLCICIAALLLLGGTCRAAVPVVTEAVVSLVDEDGRTLLEGDDLTALFEVVPGALFAAGAKGEYRLYDASGALLVDTPFSMIRAEDDWLIFRRDGLYGAMNLNGAIVVEAEWTQLTLDGAGGFLALQGSWMDDQPDAVWHIVPGMEPEQTGVSLIGPLLEVAEDRMPFMTTGGRWGYTDGSGRVAIAAQWRYADAFEHGVAAVTGEAGKGLIDRDGRIVLETQYAWMGRCESYIAALDHEGRLSVWTPDAKKRLFTVNCASAEQVGEAIAVTDADAVRLYRADGTLICKAPPHTRFIEGTDGQFIVVDGEWGERCQRLMDVDGRFLTGRYQRIMPICRDRYAWMEMAGVTYYSADLDSLRTSWDYGSIRYGLMDGAGNELLPPRFLEIRAVSEDRLLLIGEESIVLADPDGRTVREWVTVEDEAPSGEESA